MKGLKHKKSTEKEEEWNTIIFSWGKLNCVCVTSREFGIPVDGGSRISVILVQ